MAKTLGDTSPSHATPRFIAVDETAVSTAMPLSAPLVRRLVRNSNVQEAQTRRVLVHQQFPQDTDPAGATRSAVPFAGADETILRTGCCFGPYKIDASKNEIECSFGFGLDAGEAFRYYWELKSEGLAGPPPSDAWTRAANAGALDWFDSAVKTKAARPDETDWALLWIAPEDGGVSDDLGKLNDRTGTIVTFYAHGVRCTDAAGVVCNFVPAEFIPPLSQTLVIYDTTVLPIAAGTPVLGTFGIKRPTDSFSFGATFDGLELVMDPETDVVSMVGKCYEIRHAFNLAMRYILITEPEATTTGDTEARRTGALFLDDKTANIGEDGIGALAFQLGANADAVALRNPDTLVNEVHAESVPSEHRYASYIDVAAGWVPVCEHGFLAEEGLDTLEVSLAYWASGTVSGPAPIQARIRLLDDTGVTVITGETYDYHLQMAVGGDPVRIAIPIGTTIILPSGPGDIESWWQRPWYYRVQPSILGPLAIDVSAHTGTPSDALGLGVACSFVVDIRPNWDNASTRAGVAIIGTYATCRAGGVL